MARGKQKAGWFVANREESQQVSYQCVTTVTGNSQLRHIQLAIVGDAVRFFLE